MKRSRAPLGIEERLRAREKAKLDKRRQRAMLSEERLKVIREKDKEAKRKKRESIKTEESNEELLIRREREKEARRDLSSKVSQDELEKRRERKNEARQDRIAKLSEEELQKRRERQNEARRNREAKLSEEELQKRRERRNLARRNREAKVSEKELQKRRERQNEAKEYQRKKRRLLSEVELAERREHDIHRKSRQSCCEENKETPPSPFEIDMNAPVDICSDIRIDESIQEFRSGLNRTKLEEGEEGYRTDRQVHNILVCVVCDHYILGGEEYHWIHRDTLKFHENVLSPSYFYKTGINEILKEQYSIQSDDIIKHLLLSPRARKNCTNKTYMICGDCYKILSKSKPINRPPKWAISNGFAIGHLPESLANDVTPLLNNILAPVRAFNFFLAFNGGREQKITGNFTFFSQDVPQNIGALSHTASMNNNPSVFIVLLGSFTMPQLDKIRTQGCYNVDSFKKVYSFLRNNNVHYTELPDVSDVPLPKIEQVRQNDEQTEDSVDRSVEEQICWRYYFPSIEDPRPTSGSFPNQHDFATALIRGDTPSIFYHPNELTSTACLSELCPLAFPFGTGDITVKVRRENSDTATKKSRADYDPDTLKHYLKISLPQFQESQPILIIHHIYQRQKSFRSGVAKIYSSSNGTTIGNDLGTVTEEELAGAIAEILAAQAKQSKGAERNITSVRVQKLVQSIKTSCKAIGYTEEAAAEARTKMFGLWMTFGPPSLMFTFSPCDECNFTMQLYATCTATELPTVHNTIEIMSRKLAVRKSLRVKYPGACARTFYSLLQLVMKDLIGWEGKTFKRSGIFGKIMAYSSAVEEQGRTTLHVHIILWVLLFDVLQDLVFSDDETKRNQAFDEIRKYFDEVLSNTFDILETEVSEKIHDPIQCNSSDTAVIEAMPLKNLREMRHRELLKTHKGKIVKCKSCDYSWDTADVVNCVIRELLPKSKQEYPSFWPDDISFPLKHEEIELLAMRYQFDMMNIPEDATNLRRLLRLLVMLFFNTHDWKHRKSCFKKSNECRFNIPEKPCDETQIKCAEEMAVSWFNHDGTSYEVYPFKILSKRDPWDIFVNTNNPTITNVLGYNSNVVIGNVSSLYYCTLYSSKSNQQEETASFAKTLQAVHNRIKRAQQREHENGKSPRQIGLCHLLSGINAHLSCSVVGATMAWYLVTNDTRFHFSHDFKPLLLSQLEAWYKGATITKRIIFNRKRRRKSNETEPPTRNTVQNSEESNETRYDCNVDNYLYRPSEPCDLFENVSVWEFESKYDLSRKRPHNCMADEDMHDVDEQYFRLHKDHPNFEVYCLAKRTSECLPKLYYTNDFPDIRHLDMSNKQNTNEYVTVLRETYALKALLLFFPFRSKADFMTDHNNLWDFFIEEKTKLEQGKQNENCCLYKHSLRILQNIQDLMNIKDLPKIQDELASCTTLCEQDIGNCQYHRTANDEDGTTFQQHDDVDDTEAQLEQLQDYFFRLTSEETPFNITYSEQRDIINLSRSPFVISLTPSIINIPSGRDRHDSLTNIHNITHNTRITGGQRTPHVTIITRLFDSTNVNLVQAFSPTGETPIEQNMQRAICSLDAFAEQNNLDGKQNIAFQTICSSFVYSFIYNNTLDILPNDKNNLLDKLKSKGAQEQLLMCMTGPGGSGKSHVIKCCRLYCKMICDATGQPFNFSVFPVTATSNAAAALLQGCTIHSAALLNCKTVIPEQCKEVTWNMTKVLIIDEISMAEKKILTILDNHLRLLTGKRDKLYGGIHIVFAGDFMQLAPVIGHPIYHNPTDIHWHNSLNVATFLDERNHRFSEDPTWGEMLQRFQIGEATEDDIAKINQRVVPAVSLPTDIDCTQTRIAYGCYTNKKRNEISSAIFLNFISKNCPQFHSSTPPRSDTLIVKGTLKKQNKDVGPELHKLVWSTCADNNVSVDTKAKIDPCLCLIQGYPLMINTNTQKERKIVKGMIGHYVGVKWKQGCEPYIEDFHGHKVYSTIINDLESIILKLSNDGRVVEIKPETFAPTIKFPTWVPMSELRGYHITQFPVNLSLAMTGHKLQGMTLDILVLCEISTQQNWLYVLLSRVTTLNGLYLLKPLTKSLFRPVGNELKQEMTFLREKETQHLQLLNGLNCFTN